MDAVMDGPTVQPTDAPTGRGNRDRVPRYARPGPYEPCLEHRPVSTETASVFFALLSLLCLAATLGVVVLALVARSNPDSAAAGLLDDLGGVALWLAWVVALVTMLGSLYYSQIANFVPCELCWFQRIAVYPLALILLIAAIRRDRGIWVYVVPVAAVGSIVSIYQTQLQAFPSQSSFCSATTPCSARYVWEFGFVSLPFMALTAFAFIITMLLVARATDPHRDELDSSDLDRSDLAPSDLDQAGTP
jgi:disulfide bond formation protein DsbB